jgi:hypothetical protein
MFAYAATGRARLPSDPLAGHPAAAGMRARWEALAADLDDAAGHQAFIRGCAEAGLLEFAGQSYRRLADLWPEDERVAGFRQQVLQAAMARIGVELPGSLPGRLSARSAGGSGRGRAVDHTRMRRLVALLIAAVVLLIFAVGYYLLTRYQVARQFDG